MNTVGLDEMDNPESDGSVIDETDDVGEFNNQVCTAAAIELADSLIEKFGYTDSQLVVLRAYDAINDHIRLRLLEQEVKRIRREGEDGA